jgi:hypothetical protein
MIVSAQVKNKNALGLLAESKLLIDKDEIPVLDIIVPKKATGISSDIDLDEVQVGDQIWVMVMGKRYQLNDKIISIIGRAVKQPSANETASDGEEEVDLGELEDLDGDQKLKTRNVDVLSDVNDDEEDEYDSEDDEERKPDEEDGDEENEDDDEEDLEGLEDEGLEEEAEEENAESDGGYFDDYE